MLSVLLVLSVNQANFKQWGSETLDQIRRELYLPETRLYAEDSSAKKASFNWPAGVMLSALAAGARVEPKYKAWLREYADATRVYWNKAGPVPGYDVLPVPKPKDRYYDDNAWMCLALIETYEVLGDKKYLKWAEEAFKFVWSGWDEKLGGGIYWRENEKKSKNTCSNAPAAAAAFRLYQFKHRGYKAKGARIYDWTISKLLDQKTQLFSDSINLQGKVDPTKWSYNTALMIRAALEYQKCFDFAPEIRSPYYSARDWSDAALKKWRDPSTLILRDASPFAHLLFENLKLFSSDFDGLTPRERLMSGLITMRRLNRDSAGHYGPNWQDIPPKDGYKPFRLIDQASAARAFFVAAMRYAAK
ncbi:MAG: glycoside hydrolase family 76 protein [Fimbriimonadaceae bacterium]